LGGKKMKKKQALYIRKSREEENGADETLHTQKETLVRLAKQKGYKNPDVYKEIESSIKWNRPELAKLIAGIEDGRYDRVLITHIDRLGRDIGLLDDIKKLCIEHDIVIETPDNVIKFDDENHELLFGFSSVLSDYEYKRTRHRLTKGKYDAVAISNRWIGSIAPLGYTWDKNSKQLIVNEDEKKIVRKMVELALHGYSSRLIAEKVNKLGYARKGIPFKSDRVLGILQNRVYLGESKYDSKRMKKVAIAKDTHEALMTEAEFNKIQDLFNSRRSKENLQSLGVKSSVNKLLVCGVCGKGLTIQKNNKVKKGGKDASFYQIRPCRYQIDEDTKCFNAGCKISYVEDAVIQELKSHKIQLQQELVSLLENDTSDIEDSLASTLEKLQAEIIKQERKAKRLLDLYLDEELDKLTYHERKQTGENTISALKNEISIVQHKLNSLDASTQLTKVNEVMDMIDKFEDMELEEQNATLKLLIKHIVFTRTAETDNKPTIDIHWREL
jgi:DNA invertase Pin-like site-specific DNA recombinase